MNDKIAEKYLVSLRVVIKSMCSQWKRKKMLSIFFRSFSILSIFFAHIKSFIGRVWVCAAMSKFRCAMLCELRNEIRCFFHCLSSSWLFSLLFVNPRLFLHAKQTHDIQLFYIYRSNNSKWKRKKELRTKNRPHTTGDQLDFHFSIIFFYLIFFVTFFSFHWWKFRISQHRNKKQNVRPNV